MSRTKKTLLVAVVVLVLAAAVTGIAVWTAGHDPSQKEPGLYIDGKRVEDPGPAMWVGDYEVTFEDFRHYFLVMKSSFESWYGGENFWDDDPDGEMAWVLRNSVETDIVNMYTWIEIAKEYDIELDETDLAEIEENLVQQKEEYGADFDKQLAEMYFPDEASYQRITELQKLSEKAQTVYGEMMQAEVEAEAGAEADASYATDYVTAKHILVAFDENEEDTEKAEADALAKAEDLLAEIKASDDVETTFDELMWEHTDDMSGLEGNPDGYTFKEGDMVEEFYEGTLALKDYEVSEPIKTTYGYHIILRLPLDDSGKESNRETAINTAANEKKTEKSDEVKARLEVKKSDYYENINPKDIV